MKLKKGFELLKTRSINETISFINIERYLGINIPPIYRLFYENFSIPKDNLDFWYRTAKEQNKQFLSQEYIGYQKEKLYTSIIYDYEQIIRCPEAYDEYRKYDLPDGEINLFYEKILLPFCDCPAYNRDGGGIGVGTQGEEIDKIILIRDPEDEEQVEIIADNIFNFVRGLESFVAWDEPNVKNLYKNWGEDFWRVREDKES